MILPLGFLLLAAAAWTNPSQNAAELPKQLQNVGLDQRLSRQLPLNTVFRDETGQAVKLGSYFQNRPVILSFVYFDCPMLCTLELNGILRAARMMSLTAGRDFDIVTISFNPKDTPALAAQKKANYIGKYRRAGAESGWHFLTGDPPSIAAVTHAAGFRYTYDPKTGQFAHPSGILVVTQAGKIARYFYGIEYFPRDLRLALVQASSGKIGSPVDEVLLYCYCYDPSTGRYSLVIWRLLQIACVITLLGIGLLWLLLHRHRQLMDRQQHLVKA